MAIRIRLRGNLRKYSPDKRETTTLQTDVPISLRDLMRRLGIPEEEVSTAAVNGKLAPETQQVAPGDDVDLFGPIAGG